MFLDITNCDVQVSCPKHTSIFRFQTGGQLTTLNEIINSL
jgi:hypothetical protein